VTVLRLLYWRISAIEEGWGVHASMLLLDLINHCNYCIACANAMYVLNLANVTVINGFNMHCRIS